ncbi:MAG TPA: DUF190 domain-containing protein [Gammaproteobacteria bacterium]|nr:DUF190 domain-containing protein [Gammaproteobacteria bacterium]
MKTTEVTMVRIYLTESKAKLDALLKRLHDWEHVRGVTVFRGITGFGQSGVMHTANIVDLSLDLPVVVEFFDEPGKVDTILEHLAEMVDPTHIVSWQAHIRS